MRVETALCSQCSARAATESIVNTSIGAIALRAAQSSFIESVLAIDVLITIHLPNRSSTGVLITIHLPNRSSTGVLYSQRYAGVHFQGLAAARPQERMARKQPLQIAIHWLVHLRNACSAGGCILIVLSVPMSHQPHDPSAHPVSLLSEQANEPEAQTQPVANRPLGELHVGCAGWSYPHWRHKFYPPNVRAELELQYYQQRFNACEINFTYAPLPVPPPLRPDVKTLIKTQSRL